jgi:hypothetical protein
MELTAFTSRLGAGQGRLELEPGAGDHVFVLGEAEPGRPFELAVGDHAEATQSVDLTGIALVRAALRLRVPASTPAGIRWEAALVVDGAVMARATARQGRERLLSDLAANVSKLSGVHEVGVRLQLVGA